MGIFPINFKSVVNLFPQDIFFTTFSVILDVFKNLKSVWYD